MPPYVCLDYIMHNDDTQVHHSHLHHVCNPRRDRMSTRRDPVRSRSCMYSRDRSRRT